MNNQLCMLPSDECFEGWMERSELGEKYAILNYGVGGYGFDQTYLLVKETVERWREHDPIVIVGVFVGDDLNRCALSFRQWPKPRFRLVEDELVLEPTDGLHTEEWLAANPLGITSYFWRWYVHGSPFPPWEVRASWGGYREPSPELFRTCSRLIDVACAEIQGLGLESFFLLFPDADDLLREDPYRWEECLFAERLEAAGFPYVNARREFQQAVEERGADHTRFYYEGHYTSEGNEIAFGALVRGILGEFEGTAEDAAVPTDG